ncbi:MAG: hypothetical protein IKX71_04500 [Bacteroidales bacterium]|nr:hypothetical protein [Bacteroidales bacterium]
MTFKSILLSLAAVALIAVGCNGPDEPDGPDNPDGPTLSDLQIYFGADEYAAEAGETISIPFSIAGVEGKSLTLGVKADNDFVELKVSNDATYAGNIKFTAPSVMPSAGSINVTLSAEDKANSRSTKNTVPVKVSASEPFEAIWLSDMKSVALKDGGSFKVFFTVTGVEPDAVVLSTPVVTVSSGYSAAVTMTSKNEGYVTVTASSISPSVNISLKAEDNFSRSSQISKTLEIVGVQETSGAANCFIVAPGQTKAINAKVKGGSAEPLEFDYAVLLWQDTRSLVKSVAGSGEEGVIVVQTNNASGNAVVAAVQGTKIVWSWHLWVTEYDPEAAPLVFTNQSTGVTYTMMDRNLGARSEKAGNADCFGLLYQWGRKDPFVGARGIEEDVLINKYDIDGNVIPDRILAYDWSAMNSGDQNIDLAIQNPDAFIIPKSGSSTASQFTDWLTTVAADQDNDLWGYVSKYKTKYDPCPEGWRVSPTAAWTFRKLYKKGGNLNDSSPYDNTYPWYWDDKKDGGTDAGFYYNDSEKGIKYFFPLSGRRDNASGSQSGTGGGCDYWTPEPQNKYAMVELFAFGNPASETGLRRDYGYSIRCVKDYNY